MIPAWRVVLFCTWAGITLLSDTWWPYIPEGARTWVRLLTIVLTLAVLWQLLRDQTKPPSGEAS